jgi:hypothetical protein
MVEWQEEVARCVYQELGTYVEENPGTSDFILEPSDNGVFSFSVKSGVTAQFDMSGYAGNTSAEIAHNIVKDIVENYL